MASTEKQGDKKKTISRTKKHSKIHKQGSKRGSSVAKLLESGISMSQTVGPKKQIAQNKLQLTTITQHKKENMVNGAAKVSNKLASKKNKGLTKLRGSYSLRSLDRGRVLRSKLDSEKLKTTMNPSSNPVNLVTRKKKGGKKKIKKSGQDELSRIRKHIRYMLNRMNYEQSLIDAYSGEGWKGQSAEKIRPEKELERAKSEILRCKLKIREIFKHLDSLLVEGRLQESLFDPDGIDSEKIFCGKCASVEVSSDNDIILCDGICERGFHQKCLNPPLLSEDIPTGDEGWLCPQCDCKVDCIDLLSEFRGTDLSIEDSWEKIFPEAAILANGNGQYDDLDLPSDDSKDDDYDPDAQGVDINELEEGLCDSDSSSSSYNSTSSDDNMNQASVELPTDDSEDDDYDPDAPDPDTEIHNKKSSSDESDFTSDSDEFCAELKKSSYTEEASASSLPCLEIFVDSGRDDMKDNDKLHDNSEVPSAMLKMDKLESDLRSSHKRGRESLDYKKLYDEAYGKSSSDSSVDEEWTETSSPKKLKKTKDKGIEEVANHSFVKTTPKLHDKFGSRAAEKDHGPLEPHSSDCSSAAVLKNSGVASKKLSESLKESRYPTKEKKESLAQELGMTFRQVCKWFANERHRGFDNQLSSFRTATSKKFTVHDDTPTSHSKPDREATTKSPVLSTPHNATNKKILSEAFKENHYPTKEKKESLAQELGMTFRQVTKWFDHARHCSRVSAKELSNFGTATSDEVTVQCDSPRSASNPAREAATKSPVTDKKKLDEAFQENQYPSKEKKEELAQELGITFRKVSRWFETARLRFRTKLSSNPTTSSPNKTEAICCRTPNSSHNLDIGEDEKRSGAFTPDNATITSTTSTSNANPDNRVSPQDKVSTPKSSTSLWKSDSPIANGAVSNEKGKRTVDDRQKAVAKELRRMRSGR